jgi:hypothetical protein
VTQPIPDIYVLWHPDCALGEGLARRIHAWLRPGNGLGPQVFYRSLPAPEAPPGGLPPPLAGEIRATSTGALQASPSPNTPHTNMQVVLLLIDDHMIADAAWRHWLTRLAQTPPPAVRRVFLPVALDSTAFNVPSALRELNFLRPAGLPLPESNPPGPPAAVEIVVRSLLKQLTESLCRLLLREDSQPPAPAAGPEGLQPKVMLFLSHAKVDGTVPAKSIRDYIYSQTQLAAFYDENDIPLGSVFSRVLQSSLPATQTAAMIAVRSARYESRPWCRRELALFRRPIQEVTEPGKAEQWRLNPTVVVDALDDASQTPGIPELGNAPLIRWSDKVSDQAEQIVTIVLRDALLGSFHASVGRTILTGPDCIVLNWLPDPTTLLHIRRVREKEPLRVVYPGRGLSALELDTLDEFFPHLSFQSFDQVSP